MERRPSDAHLDQLLRRSYAATSTSAGVCPDEGLLAAFIDGGLDQAERRQVTQHAASCPRCAQILAIAVESPVPADAPAAPVTVRPWLGRWRWVIPMATAATVAGIWIATRDVIPPMPSPASAPQQESAAVDLTSQSAPPPATTTGAPAAVRQPPAGAVDQAPARTPPPFNEPLPRRRELAEPTATARNQAPAIERASPAPVSAAPAPPPPPPVAPPATPAAVTALPPPPPSQVLDEIRPRADAQGQGRGGAGGGRSGVAGGVVPGTFEERVTILPETPVRDVPSSARQVIMPSRMWRTSGGLIQQSVDEGRTWTTVYDAGRRLLAMSTPTSEAGWFVGERGLIVRRVGAGWSAITPPAGVDIVGIQATDARIAIITFADGRVFATTDAGTTWTQK